MPPPMEVRPFTRETLAEEVFPHPGVIDIMGVQLDLAVGEDAALAAKWLDGQLAALARTFLPRADS